MCGKCFYPLHHLLSYILSLVVAQILHQDQGDSGVWVLGLGRHPRLDDPMRRCDLGPGTVTRGVKADSSGRCGGLR